MDRLTSFTGDLQLKIDSKTKPLGALGHLERMALQIGRLFNSVEPSIEQPYVLVFAADHGIANEGVSAYPAEVTAQMVFNFLNGGAAINVFCRQNNINLQVIDAGVNFTFDSNLALSHLKEGYGTKSFLTGPAMTVAQKKSCFEKGAHCVEQIYMTGSNCVGFGEMGIGNTTTSGVLMHLLTNIPVEECIGSGTGVVNEALDKKIRIVKQSLANYKGNADIEEKMAYFGGFEIFQMAGGMLKAYENKMLILVDGFISTVAFLVAQYYEPLLKENAIFCHCSNEKGHRALIQFLEVTPILDLNLRLGEGTGVAIAYPIINNAIGFLNEMASFEKAGVSTNK